MRPLVSLALLIATAAVALAQPATIPDCTSDAIPLVHDGHDREPTAIKCKLTRSATTAAVHVVSPPSPIRHPAAYFSTVSPHAVVGLVRQSFNTLSVQVMSEDMVVVHSYAPSAAGSCNGAPPLAERTAECSKSYLPRRLCFWCTDDEEYANVCNVRLSPFTSRCYTVQCHHCAGSSLEIALVPHYDVLILQLLGGLVAAAVLKKALVRSRTLQLLFVAAFGLVMICAIVLFFMFKDLQNTRIGRVGIFAMISVGGFTALAQGAASAVLDWVMFELQSNPMVQYAAVGSGVMSASFVHWWFGDRLQKMFTVTLSGVQLMLAIAAAALNPELTCLAALGGLWLYFMAPWTLAVVWSSVVHGEPAFGEAKEKFDAAVYQEKSFVKPMAEGYNGTPAQKRKLFQKVGEETTRRELQKLAAHIRASPALAARMQSPNAMYQFAGVGNDDSP